MVKWSPTFSAGVRPPSCSSIRRCGTLRAQDVGVNLRAHSSRSQGNSVFLTLGGSEGLTGKCTYFVRVVEGKVGRRHPVSRAALLSAPSD
eukprot:scaffold11206_cov117-Isochrysis_galbana.AAC.15